MFGIDLRQAHAGVAGFTNAILTGSPNTKVLATSRELLGAASETEFRVLPFPVPDLNRTLTAAQAIEVPAVELFAERAAANADFALTDAEAPIVMEICRRLGGIPLSIERAALAVGYLGIGQLVSRLEDYLRLPNAGYRT